jgi:small GTP-binding protein
MSRPLSFKFILIGTAGVGKSAILKRLVDDTYTESAPHTVGVEFETTSIVVENQKVSLHVWDTAGSERYRAMAKSYYRNAVGVILVFDITDRQSFDDLPLWLADIHILCDANAVIQLIGNKSDLKEKRAVTVIEADGFARQQRLEYLEASAKDGENVRDAFVRVAAELLRVTRGQRISMDGGPMMPDFSEATVEKKCC